MSTYLLTADVHLGRHSAGYETDAERSARRAWVRLNRIARARGAEAILVAGDLLDGRAGFQTGIGALEEGFREGGELPIIAVSGNHDHDSLPYLADHFGPDRLRLLGRNAWESLVLPSGLRMVGRCFRDAYERSSLLTEPPPEADLGLLHADVYDAGSPYNPVSSAALGAAPVGRWLLGHIHKGETRGNWSYPGSPQALDFGETGPHGAILAEWRGGRFAEWEAVPISNVAYETISVPLDPGMEDELAYLSGAQRAVNAARARHGEARLRVRLRPEGRTRLPLAKLANATELAGADIDRVELDGVRPDWDLAELARGRGAPALLARVLLALEEDASPAEPETADALDRIRRRVERETDLAAFAPLDTGSEGESEPAFDWKPAARRAAVRMMEAVSP
ncbi:DNA repair exonuclease [soil metagenome]